MYTGTYLFYPARQLPARTLRAAMDGVVAVDLAAAFTDVVGMVVQEMIQQDIQACAFA